MNLTAFHSALLTLFASHLSQVIDVVNLISTCRAIHDKLVSVSSIVDRLAEAKESYWTLDLCVNLENACEDQQQHFIDLYEWISIKSLRVGTIRSGSIDAIEAIRPVSWVCTDAEYTAAGYSRNIEMVEYVLTNSRHFQVEDCHMLAAITEGATMSGDLGFVQTIVAKFRNSEHSPHLLDGCVGNSAFLGAIKGDNVDVVKWIIREMSPDRTYDLRLIEKCQSSGVREVIFSYCEPPPDFGHKLAAWFISGNLEEIENHRKEVENLPNGVMGSLPYGLIETVMRVGTEQMIDTAIKMIGYDHKRIARAALYSARPELIRKYVTRQDVLKKIICKPETLITVLDHFNLRVIPSVIKQLTSTYSPNQSCLYHLAKRNFSAFLVATRTMHDGGGRVSSVVTHVSNMMADRRQQRPQKRQRRV